MGIGLGRVLACGFERRRYKSSGEMGVSFERLRRDQRDFHVGDGDRLVAVIGHDEENRQEAVLREVHGEDLGLFRRVVRIGGNGDFLVAMEIVRGIVDGGLRHRLHKVLRPPGTAAATRNGAERHDERRTETLSRGLHGFDYRCSCVLARRCGGLEWLSLSYFLYSLVLAAGMLLSLPYWLYQILRHGKYRTRICGAHGKSPGAARGCVRRPGTKRVIWVHAVSVGEVLAVSGLVEQMRRSFPQHRVLVSTTTDTGQELARKRFGEENVFYFPLDFAFAIRPYLQALQPELVVLAETEFWPNFLASGACQRSAHCGGQRAHLRPVVAELPPLSLGPAQNAGARRPVSGANAGRRCEAAVDRRGAGPRASHGQSEVRCESAFAAADCGKPAAMRWRQKAPGRCWSAAARWKTKNQLLLKAFENVRVEHPRAVMILAPRHPERFDEVAILLQQLGIAVRTGARVGQGEAAGGRSLARRFHRRTGRALCAGRCCIRRWKPGAARRAQHYRTGAAWRRHRHRKPHGKFSRHRGPVSKPRCGAHRHAWRSCR